MANKYDIFHRHTVSEITKGRDPIKLKNKINEIRFEIDSRGDLRINGHVVDPRKEYLVIDGNLIPAQFFYTKPSMGGIILTRTEASRKFMKHGDEIRFPRYRNVDDAVNAMQGRRKVPVDIRAERFDNAEQGYYCCWSFVPLVGNDKRKRRAPIVEIVRGAKLYGYASRQGTPIEVTPYGDARRVAIDGAEVIVKVPSRTPKRSSYQFKEVGIPIVDNDFKYVLANCIITTHDCEAMMYFIRYKRMNDKENSRVFNWDAHEVAGHYGVIDHYWNEEHNMISLAMSQIPIPSQKLAEISDLLAYNTVILTRESPEQEKRSLYPLDMGELEILLQLAVKTLKHDKTLFCDTRRDGNLRDYKWRGM